MILTCIKLEKKNDQNRQSWWIRTFGNKWKKQKAKNVISFTARELEVREGMVQMSEKRKAKRKPCPSSSPLCPVWITLTCHSFVNALKILRHCRKLGRKLFSPTRQFKAVTCMATTQRQTLAWKTFCSCLSPHFTLGQQGFLQVTGGQTWHHHPERRLVMDITFC